MRPISRGLLDIEGSFCWVIYYQYSNKIQIIFSKLYFLLIHLTKTFSSIKLLHAIPFYKKRSYKDQPCLAQIRPVYQLGFPVGKVDHGI